MLKYKQFFDEHKVKLILPYFGALPNYFSLWLKSASYNENIHFWVIGDQLPKQSPYDNIEFLHMSFEDMVKIIQSKINCKCKIKTPYKLCDFKPAYGYIFSEYLKEYEYWGHCDPDIIWGRKLEECLFSAICNKSDKIYKYGHLSVYRNTDEINKLFMKQSSVEKINYKDVFSMDYVAHFDEGCIIQDLFKNKIKYDKVDFADISYWTYQFQLSVDNGHKNEKQIYFWKNGNLFGYYLGNDGVVRSEEIIYIHLQKRKMEYHVKPETDRFLILPNKFTDVSVEAITPRFIEQNSVSNAAYEKAFKKRRRKTIVEHCLSGAIKYRAINKLRINNR